MSAEPSFQESIIGAFIEKIDALEVSFLNVQKKLCDTETARSIQSAKVHTLTNMIEKLDMATQQKERALAMAQNEIAGRDKQIAELESLLRINNVKHREEVRNLQRIIDSLLIRAQRKEKASDASH